MPAKPLPARSPLCSSVTEVELVFRAAGGEAAAFEMLMRRHTQLVFGTGRSILVSDAETEEVARTPGSRSGAHWAGFVAMSVGPTSTHTCPRA